MESGRISIIILCYNNGMYWKDCIQSVLMQDYADIEIVISEDAGDKFDETEIREYIRRNAGNNIQNLVINRNSENLGIVGNYKKAIELSSGEYFFYLAIDDCIYDNKVISDVMKYFEENESEIFTGHREVNTADGQKYLRPYEHEIQCLKTKNNNELMEIMLNKPFIAGACTPFSRRLLEQYGFVPEGYKHLEDWPRYLELLKHGVKIGFFERILIRYRLGGISGSKNLDILKDYAKVRMDYGRTQIRNLLDKSRAAGTLIGWGASENFRLSYQGWVEICGREIDYLVDGNSRKVGSMFEGFEVKDKELLFGENREGVFVLIFSNDFFIPIAGELEEHGLRYGGNYGVVGKNLVDCYCYMDLECIRNGIYSINDIRNEKI